jgi:putative aminopeptidase FrvX
MDLQLLKKLCDVPGIPGREEQVRALTAETLEPLVDRLYVDNLGNLIGVRKGEGLKVMLSGHMDEIGFMVNHIDEQGFLRLLDLGGNMADAMEGQRVIVGGKEPLVGVLFRERGALRRLGTEEEKRQPPRTQEFFVDLGLPKEKLAELVSVGDPVTMDRETIEMGDMVCGKAMDDRVGVFVMIEALRKLSAHEAEIFAVGSVQEEQGCRGAKVAAYGLSPDVGVALDVAPALDFPGVKEHEQVARLGKGAAISVKDNMTLSDVRLVAFLQGIAEEEGIPYQKILLPFGGTDAGTIHLTRAGIPSVTISIPCRYGHTGVEVVHKGDVEACSDLLARFLERAHKGKFGESEELKGA